MSVIIRLQNLPWSANALDIRQYFGGLSIPEGGVHIVGGELGDAFIAFSTDEDARQAFLRNNGKIKEVQISLMLSSRTEMQRVIEQARAKSYAAFMQPTASAPAPTPTPVPAHVPLPSVVPQMIPAAVPEIKKEKDVINDKVSKRDNRRRSRSKSKERDRRDRSRDRKDRRYRDRSRSKSRERKSSRRRDRSRSRNRSRSRERDRRNISRDLRKRSEEKSVIPPFHKDQRKPDNWASQVKPDVISGLQGQAGARAAGFQANLDPSKRSTGSPEMNGFQGPGFSNNENIPRNIRDSWPPSNQGGFPNNRNNDNFNHMDNFSGNDRFRKRGFNRFEHDSNVCIALEPFFGGYGDIRKFFHGMFISNKGIKFINDSNGRRTGMVYVQFSSLRTKEDAISMSGRMLNGLEITISHLEDREFEEAVDRYLPPPFEDNNTNEKFKGRLGPKVFNHKNEEAEPELKDFTCLTVEDLPNYVKDQDILHIFEMYPLVALNVVNRRRGGPVAYVKFGSKEEAKKALEETSSHIVGGKQVTVKPCADHHFEEVNKQQNVSLSSPKAEDIGTDCLSVSRLPQKTTDKDIADFFSDIGVIPTKIHLMSNNLGFTGEAYCEFLNTEEATRAVKKNETMLGSASISVVPITRRDMDNILESAFPAPMEQSLMPLTKNPQLSPPNPFSGGNQQQDNFGGPNRTGFFNNRNKFEFDGPRGQARYPPPRGGPGSRMRFHGPQMDGEDVPPGCTIYLKNVPYKANTNDILDFFEGFDHTGNVSRRFNPNNTPTDEAKITFYDPDEASRAVDHLQKMKIWDRSIYLRQD